MEDRLIQKVMRSTVTRDAQLMVIPCLGGGKEYCLLSVLAVLAADCLCERALSLTLQLRGFSRSTIVC